MKPFLEVLQDGFQHITEISDPEVLKQLREDGILIDSEGLYVFSFGDSKEYDLRVEPYGEEGHYLIALYKNGVLLNNKIPVWNTKTP
jgi:hypothetical protein